MVLNTSRDTLRNYSKVIFNLLTQINFYIFLQTFYLICSSKMCAAMSDVLVDYIPGLTPTPLSAFPTVMYGKGLALLDHCLEPFKVVSKSQCLLLCSVFDLEPNAVESLKSKFQIPVFSVGPSFPHFRLKEILLDTSGDNYSIEWLNEKEPKTVLYVSFGSFCSVSDEQTHELATGLVHSGVKFLRVARGNTPRLSKICNENGLIVPWCDQLSVLSHQAIGGFLTHCGWSSTQEGLFTGTTFLTFPILMDQETNSKMIVDDFKVGWRLKGSTGADKVVKWDEISRKVKRFMDSDSSEVKEMRLRAEELRNRCVRAVYDTEGSYEVNFSGFVDFILSCKEQKLHG